MARPTRRFAFRLALALGVWDVDALLREMPSGLLAEWEAFFALEPWGAQIENVRTALIASTIANVFRGERTRAYRIEDFLLRSNVDKTQPSPEAASAALKEFLSRRHA